MKDSIIILSGGMDSVTMLYDYADSIAVALSFDYGSNHNRKELPFAAYHCERLGIEHIIIPLGFIKQYFHSSLLSGAADIPEGKYDDENMRSTVVPFRNGIMLAIAAGMAEDRHLSRILMANHSGDHAIYPDCRPAFVNALAGAVREGTYNGVELFTPYTNWTKTAVANFSVLIMPRPGVATRAATSTAASAAPVRSDARHSHSPASPTQPNTNNNLIFQFSTFTFHLP